MKKNTTKFIPTWWFFIVFILFSFTTGSNQTLKTIYEGNRTFGNFQIKYEVKNPGYITNCTLKLGNELVGLSTVNVNNNKYLFDVIIDNNYLKGQLSGQFYPSNQVSTLEGDFSFGEMNGKDSIILSQRFKGTVGGWFAIDTTDNE